MLAEPVSAFQALRQAAERAQRLGRPVLASWTGPCARQDPIEYFARHEGAEYRGLWLRPSTGEALVAIGCARELLGHGVERFEQVASAWRELLADAAIDGVSGEAAHGPVAFGGFSFDPRHPRSESWKAFSDARLVVPKQLLVVRGSGAWLTSNAMVGLDAPHAPAPTRESTPARQALGRGQPPPVADGPIGAGLQPPPAPGRCTGGSPEPTPLSPEAWQVVVAELTRRMRTHDLGAEKVVLARAHTVRVRRSVEAALRHLAASYPTCTVFAIAHGDACFLGATPEELIALRDGLASTAALAGSAPRGATAAEDEQLARRLLRDTKEQREHALVVEALSEGLAQACTRTIADVQPRVHKLANVQHLLTPIRGQVAAGRTVLDLVARLHPTPAVGGHPREPALELIRRYESLDRGWYAGPIGWMNRDGEGEFVVGLRSALVRGEAATLYAGCGIVADSDPPTEAAEWGWKLRPMLAALDAET